MMEDRRLMFVEFPTPSLLHDANQRYGQLGHPTPSGEEGEILPYPTVKGKRQVFNVKDHQGIDDHAIKTPDSLLSEDLHTLVSFLEKECKTDLAKIRAFFRFIAAGNLETLPSFTPPENTALWYFTNIKTLKGDYTDIFIALCRAAGITCQKVEGFVKGVGYVPGDNLDEKGGKHSGSWAACLVDGEWRLVDVHWGSRHTTGGAKGEWELIDGASSNKTDTNEVEAMKYECNEYYFLTDPHEFIYSHFPTGGEEWQLLARPVTKREFQDMVYLEPGFFELGLRVVGYPKCVLQIPEGEIDLVFGLPYDGTRSFMYNLWKSSMDGMTNLADLEDIKLERYVFLCQNREQNTLTCKIKFPVAGKFKFELFAKDASRSEMFTKVSSYIIECAKPYEECSALPENSRREWGPGADLEKAGLTAVSHLDGLVEAEEGLVEMCFKADKEVDILHHLSSNTKDKEQLKNYVIHRHDENEILVNIKLPEKGQYAFNMYAKKDSTEPNFANVCSYLVSSAEPAYDLTPFPEVANGKLGPTELNKKYGLVSLSPNSALMEGLPSGELDVIFTTPKPLDMTHRLELQTAERKERMDQHVFPIVEPDKVTFRVWIPEPGMYGLTIFAKERGAEGALDCVYQGVIDAKYNRKNCVPFPRINPPWGEGYELLKPMEGKLSSNRKAQFALKVPKAFYVAVIGSNGWTQLENHDGVWEGEVDTGPAGSDLKVSAEFDKGSGSYTTLLLFSVVAEEELQKLTEEQEKEAKVAAERIEEQCLLKEKREADYQDAKKELVDATKESDADRLRQCLRNVEKKRYSSRLKPEMEEARQKLLSLESIGNLCNDILDMEEATIDELQSYDDPPLSIHEVLVACFLLLQKDEHHTRSWPECKKLCQAPDLRSRVKDFDVETLHPEIASRAYDILTQHRLDSVHDTNKATAVIYTWTLGMIEELRNKHPSAKDAPPADVPRQKEIFTEKDVKEDSDSDSEVIEDEQKRVLEDELQAEIISATEQHVPKDETDEDIEVIKSELMNAAKEDDTDRKEEQESDLEVCKNELIVATRESDADRLRQAIDEVENKGYMAELKPELQEARIKLDSLEKEEIEILDDAQKVATQLKLPEEAKESELEVCKNELISATWESDSDRLRSAIHEVEKKGYLSELKKELEEARLYLSSLEKEEIEIVEDVQRVETIPVETAPKLPEDLPEEKEKENDLEVCRKELISATLESDAERLRLAIKAAENKGYAAKLGRELEKANIHLLSLEKEEIEILTDEVDVEEVELIAAESTKKEELPEEGEDNVIEKIKTELINATKDGDIDRLRLAIQDVEMRGYSMKMEPELMAAKEKLTALLNVDINPPANILELDAVDLDKLQRCDDPSPQLHDVLVACLLLLKEHEGKTRNWSECKNLCQASELKSRVKEFEAKTLHPEIASRANSILVRCKPEAVQNINKAASVIYTWTVSMIEELRNKDPTSKGAPPANISRQKEIFNVKEPKEPGHKSDCTILFLLFCLTMILFTIIMLWRYSNGESE